MSRYDAIVVGAGHNGLTCAAYLAKAGYKVLVLEGRDVVGGLAAGEEFHPGYRSVGLLQDSTGVRPAVIEELGLKRHGLQLREHRPDVLALGDEGRTLWLTGDRRRADVAPRWLEYHALLDRLRPVLRQLVDAPALDVVDVESNPLAEALPRALQLRRLGAKDMMELLRLPPMCVDDWLSEFFTDELLKAALALPAVAGTWMGPRSPGSNMNLLRYEAAAGPDVVGGGAALVAALEASAKSNGAEIRTGARVTAISVTDGRVAGVVLGNDERIEAPVVAVSSDARRAVLDLLPRGALLRRTVDRMRAFRMRGTTAQLLLALQTPPKFRGVKDGASVEFARLASSPLAIERAFDAVKYRKASERPALEIHVPSVARGDLAPKGHAVMSVLVHYVPHQIEEAWNDDARQRLGDRVISQIEEHVPGLGSTIVAEQLLGPPEIEERYAVTGGQIHHGEHALDQLLVRPVPELLQHSTPLGGFFLCGSGTHPGGGLTGAPGRLAAAAIAKNRG